MARNPDHLDTIRIYRIFGLFVRCFYKKYAENRVDLGEHNFFAGEKNNAEFTWASQLFFAAE